MLLSASMALSAQQPFELVVQAGKIGAPIQPTMYGLFFEDINFGADGGLYAELIKNRSFDFPQQLMGWKIFGNTKLMHEGGPFDKNPHYVRLSNSGHDHKHTGLENEGFVGGMGIHKDESYRFSFWARVPEGGTENIRVELVNSRKNPFAKQEVAITSKEWKKYEVIIKATETDAHALLRIFLTSKGTLDMEHISLFPVETWQGDKNGMRKDLAQALYDVKPGVFRFPGGCIVEGTDLDTRYDWKKTVGPVENRPINENRWHYTFQNRFFPDYFQTGGLGYYEYFLLSESLGATPLPVVSCGLACQYQNKDMCTHVPVDELEPYIQDALDLIEFANGDVTTTWGKVRAEMGHPASFKLEYIGIGNEQWGPEYPERLELFVKAIRKKHPEIKIIGSSGPNSEGADFEYLWPEMKRLKVDLVDEHFYRSEEWFRKSGDRYDHYDRKGPKVFAGEYACHPGNRKNNFESALLEAAFLTGTERNADIVHMTTYAPLLAHVDAWQWRPDMIWFDNLNHVRSVNYYVQQLYAHNAGTNVLPITHNKKPAFGQENLFASAVWDDTQQAYIVKVVNTANEARALTIALQGVKKNRIPTHGEVITLHSANLDQENTLEHPNAVTPQTATFQLNGNGADLKLGANTFAIYKFKL